MVSRPEEENNEMDIELQNLESLFEDADTQNDDDVSTPAAKAKAKAAASKAKAKAKGRGKAKAKAAGIVDRESGSSATGAWGRDHFCRHQAWWGAAA